MTDSFHREHERFLTRPALNTQYPVRKRKCRGCENTYTTTSASRKWCDDCRRAKGLLRWHEQ
jgi:hypothetical protein